MKKIILSLMIIFFAQCTYALNYKILAVVEGISISNQQLKDRINLVISSSGMQDNVENRKKITTEIMDILINEAIQANDAKEKGIKISPTEINDLLTDLEKSNNLQPGGFHDFISKKGISYNAVLAQIKASIIWRKIIVQYIRPGIEVTKEDINNAKNYQASAPKSEKVRVNISEIVIPIEYGKEAETKDLAETIVRTARKGENFGELAVKHSVAKSAPKKGLVGWMPQEGMIEPLASNIKKTEKGGVTNPIKMQSMYVILKVNDRQIDSPDVGKDILPENRAMMNKIEEASKKYIKKLRDSAYIEKKYDEADLYNEVWGE